MIRRDEDFSCRTAEHVRQVRALAASWPRLGARWAGPWRLVGHLVGVAGVVVILVLGRQESADRRFGDPSGSVTSSTRDVHRRSGRVREYHLDACVWRPSRRRAIDVPAHGPVQGSARARRGTEPGVAELRVLARADRHGSGMGRRGRRAGVLRRRVRGGAPFTGGSWLADRPGRRRRAARRPARRRAPSTGAAIRRGGRRRHTAAEHPPRQPRRPARPKIPRQLRRETEPLRPLSPRPARLRQRPFPAPTARRLPVPDQRPIGGDTGPAGRPAARVTAGVGNALLPTEARSPCSYTSSPTRDPDDRVPPSASGRRIAKRRTLERMVLLGEGGLTVAHRVRP